MEFSHINLSMKRGRSDEDDNQASGYNGFKRSRVDSFNDHLRPLFFRSHTLPNRISSCQDIHVSTIQRSPSTIDSPLSAASVPALVDSSPNDPEDMEMDLDLDDVSDAGQDGNEQVDIVPLFSSPHRPPRIKVIKSKMSLQPPSPYGHLNSGRIPTPMFSSFPVTPQPDTPRLISPRILYSTFSPNHAMPSPIREDIMDSHMSKLSVRDEPMDLESPFSPSDLEPDSGNSLPKSRTRSYAMSANSRRKLFMGYLANCDKCRDKVPGHYVHFIEP